ncbi:Eco57I restriction-modification methylase domain-containing protein [Lysinibacillus sp. RS11]|uniref:Eco57I restriction-modification methylase domain-containing protein n=1 Tax=Lysinibacillus sp. RS11 TaxID=3242682 RepID=UPI0035C73131
MNEKCQIFTPEDIAEEMLNIVNYEGDLFGKQVLENSCGDGNILKRIVIRYIESALANKIPLEDIKMGLEKDIYAAEIDEKYYKKCIQNLDELINGYNIHDVKWNIINKDSLKIQWKVKFDFIIGNPPYIKYSEMDVESRLFLNKNYKSCINGKFDYCYAFIENSINNLNTNGKMVYLIPNSIFKNVFGKELRKILLPKLTEVYDYKGKKLFKEALTSSAIIVVDSGENLNHINYYDMNEKNIQALDKSKFGDKWVFSNPSDLLVKEKCRFSDYFNVSISIATLLNKAFVINDYIVDNEYLIVGEYKVEKELVRTAASPKSLAYKKNEMIIFPYHYDKGILKRYETKVFEEKFPEATKYLQSFYSKLKKRKSSKNVSWFEYGRTQALKHLNQPKLLLSTVVTKTVNIYELPASCIPYSGIYITQKEDIELEVAKKILSNKDFYDYVKLIGINASGNSLRITVKDIGNFEFEKEMLINHGENEI